MKIITAVATPFKQDGRCQIDTTSLVKLLETQKQFDVLVCGTTGEGALVSDCEKKLIINVAKAVLPDCNLWVGVSDGATQKAVESAVWAAKLGANGLLIAPPAFFKATKEGYFRHVEAIKRACGLPIMLYNAPSRCGYTVWADVAERLAASGDVCMKDAGTDPEYTARLSQVMPVFCGNESWALESMERGASGVVSVVANVAPRLTAKIWQSGFDVAHKQLYDDLVQTVFSEINPIAVKYMLYKLGIFGDFSMRLPLTSASAATRQKTDEFLQAHKDKIV